MAAIFVREMMRKTKLRAAVLMTVTILGVLVALFAGGILTPRGFGIAGLFAMLISGMVWYFAISSVDRPMERPLGQKETAGLGSRGLYIRVAIILTLLVFAAWETRGGPLLPRLIGASILILFLLGTIRAKL
jgi:drug/metabolite transporter (DMT)-like permease